MLNTPKDGMSPSPTPSISFPEVVFKQSVRIGSLGGVVAACFYPLDLGMHWLHFRGASAAAMSGTVSALPITRYPMVAALSKFVRGYWYAAQGATIKNGVLTHRENIHNTLHDKNPIQEDTGAAAGSTATALEFKQMAATSGVVAFADTTLTQYHRTLRILQQQTVLKPGFSYKHPKKAWEKLVFASKAYPQICGKNALTVLGMLWTSQLQAKAAETPGGRFSRENLPLHLQTFGIVGCVAFGSNATDLLYKRIIVQMNEQYQVPTFRSVARDMIAKEGRRALCRGFLGSIVYTGAAYAIVNYSERLIDDGLMPKVEGVVSSAKGLAKAGLFGRSGDDAPTAKVNPTPEKTEVTPATSPKTP